MSGPWVALWLALACRGGGSTAGPGEPPQPGALRAQDLVGIWEDDLGRAEGLNTTRLLAAGGTWAERLPHWDEAPCDAPEVSRGGTWTLDRGALVLVTTWRGSVADAMRYGEPCVLIGGWESRTPTPETEERLALGPCADDWDEPWCVAAGGRDWWRRAAGDPEAAWPRLCPWCNPTGPGPIEE